MERYLTWEDVAERLQIGERKAREIMTQMRCVTVGRKKRVSEAELAAWIRSKETPPALSVVKTARARKAAGQILDWRKALGVK